MGAPARSDLLADAVRSRAGPGVDVAGVVADMERSGWGLSTAVVDIGLSFESIPNLTLPDLKGHVDDGFYRR